MQTARRFSKIGRMQPMAIRCHRPLTMQYQYSKRSFAKKNYQINYEESNIGWEKGAYWACFTAFSFVFICISSSSGSADLIDKILPFSFGAPRQGAYFPPHCKYITPYDDIVREHKWKQRRLKQQQSTNDTVIETEQE